MANVNKVILVGNLTCDPEARHTPKGTAVTDLVLAISRPLTMDGGASKNDVTFVEVTFWGRQAEIVAEHCVKGSGLYVEGRLTLDQWKDRDTGQARTRLKVTGEQFQFIGEKPTEKHDSEKKDNEKEALGQ